ncbi:hypothetical protein AMQ84_20880 [Paenibacillus riograndensis]|uniref:6-hydroxymethylpterin diphosphokinase MptE-like domain-containing protein n=1 Tax=Paenibacillus riograndensis TaxID=483937 RepID=A0A132TRS3_9BACL|nr:6-hydroxymethylpterin diphosphokinase MptE-like protein [Paenibacillus riograndensis]KWX74042.1 hypothetical protein AMQ84_20880 [Paenibacillus riograndensis]KWX85389.1 hypothetical protein AMQ83_25055 [Paenibacillus riograndensis]
MNQKNHRFNMETRFPHLVNLQSDKSYKIIPSVTGEETLIIYKNGRQAFIHNPEGPKKEAVSWVEQFRDIQSDTHVIFFGVGLGYHIQAFLQQHPDLNFSLIEPSVEIMHAFLEQHSYEEWLLSSRVGEIMVDASFPNNIPVLSKLIDRVSRILVVVWQAYPSMFPEELKRFNESVHELVSFKKEKMKVTQYYEKEWALNSIHNFPYVLDSPDFLQTGKEHIQGKPVIIVAAGPSLNDEIEHLRFVKEQGLAYIFSVGSAVNALIEQGVYPHGTFSYDPNPYNVNVIKKIIDQQITTIPLIFGSTVGRHTLDHYPGPKMHLIISQDGLSIELLKNKAGEVPPIINDAPSVAVIAVQCFVRMQASKIILVGQNFAYRNAEYYAAGITNSEGIAFNKNMPQIPDVHGSMVSSHPSFIKMKAEMELYIRLSKGIEFLNTTQGGANIVGAAFMPLRDLISLELLEQVVDVSWLAVEGALEVDWKLLENRINALEKAGEDYRAIFKLTEQQLINMVQQVKDNKLGDVPQTLSRFDDLFAELISNTYFRIYILPRNRMSYELLYSKTNSIQNDPQLLSKVTKVLKYFGDFIWKCNVDYSQSKEIFDRFHTTILNKNKEKIHDK